MFSLAYVGFYVLRSSILLILYLINPVLKQSVPLVPASHEVRIPHVEDAGTWLLTATTGLIVCCEVGNLLMSWVKTAASLQSLVKQANLQRAKFVDSRDYCVERDC